MENSKLVSKDYLINLGLQPATAARTIKAVKAQLAASGLKAFENREMRLVPRWAVDEALGLINPHDDMKHSA